MSSMCRLLVTYEISWTPGVQLAPIPTLFETATLLSLKTLSAKLMTSIDLERKDKWLLRDTALSVVTTLNWKERRLPGTHHMTFCVMD